MSVNNQISFRNTLESTTPSRSPSSGALILKGGLTINCTAPATSSSSGGALTISGGASFGQDVHISGSLNAYSFEGVENLETPGFGFTDTTASNSPSTGALVLFGGIGIDNDTDSISTTNGGTFTSSGGVSIGKTLYAKDTIVSGVSEFVIATVSQDTNLPFGGLGINFSDDASSSTNGGAMTIGGGLAVSKNLFVGDSINTLGIRSDSTLAVISSDLNVNSDGASQLISKNTIVTAVGTAALTIDTIILQANSTHTDSIKIDSVNGGINFTTPAGFTLTPDTLVLESTTDISISSNGTVTINATDLSASDITIQGPVTIDSSVISQDTTPSTSITTGSVVVSGGLGVSESLHAVQIFDNGNRVFTDHTDNLQTDGNGELSMTNAVVFQSAMITGTIDAANSTNGGTLTVSGGAAIAKQLFVGDSITTPLLNVTNALVIPAIETTSNTPSNTPNTGALISLGGVGVQSDVDSVSPSNGGALTVAGGASIAKTLRCGEQTSTETITTTGEFDLNNIRCNVTTDPINTDFIKVYPESLSLNYVDVAISSTGQYQFAVDSTSYVHFSNDYGINWNINIPNNGINANAVAMSLTDAQYRSITEEQYGDIYTSNDYGGTWTRFILSIGWKDIAMSGTGETQVAVGNSSQIYRSVNFGGSWNTTSSPTYDWKGVAVSYDGQIQTAVCWSDSETTGSLFNSIDSGTTWNANVNAGSRYWKAVAMSNNAVYQTAVAVGSSDNSIGDYIYHSSDSGATWTQVAGTGVRRFNAVTVSGTGIYQFATTIQGLIYYSGDYGVTWTTLPSVTSNKNTTCISTSYNGDYTLFGVTLDTLYRGYINNDVIFLDNTSFNQNNTLNTLLVPSTVSLTCTSFNQRNSFYLGTPQNGSIINARKCVISAFGQNDSKNRLDFYIDGSIVNSRAPDLDGSAAHLSILPNGNVGIGATLTPTSKLHITGGIFSDSITISAPSQLNRYYTQDWTTTVSVIGNASPPSPVSITVRLTRIGNKVSVHFPDFYFVTGIAGSTDYFETQDVPIDFRPSTNASIITRNQVNSHFIGLCRYDTISTKFRFYHNINESSFMGGGGYYFFTRTLSFTI